MKQMCAGLLLAWLLSAGPAFATEPPSFPESEAGQMGEQVRELSHEMTRVFIEKLQAFLDHELDRLRRATPQTRKELHDQLSTIEARLQSHPDDASGHYEVGRVYDRLGDGANAILHMQQAETLFKKQGNAKGLAEARRDLRAYFSRYEFKPEDFDLSR